jgi:hypothetical protein
MDLEKFIIQFHDYLAPKLDTYEQAIYLYIFRHSRLIGKDETVIGFKSARSRMACGVGEKGKPMSENSAYRKLKSLEAKGCLQIISSEHTGTRIRLLLPHEITGMLSTPKEEQKLSVEEMDFFNDSTNRKLILEREGHRCFYCFCFLNKDNYVVEHIVSRPDGDNSYRNVVAACRQCNNRKGKSSVEDFLRTLYRDGLLNAQEFEKRQSALKQVRIGELKPKIKV